MSTQTCNPPTSTSNSTELLTPLHFARRMGCSRDTVYRWLDTGRIPAEFVHRRPIAHRLIDARAIDYLLEAETLAGD